MFLENAKAAGLRNVDGQGTDLLQNADKMGFRLRMLFPRQAEKQVLEVFLATFKAGPTPCIYYLLST